MKKQRHGISYYILRIVICILVAILCIFWLFIAIVFYNIHRKKIWDYNNGWLCSKPYFYLDTDMTGEITTSDGHVKSVNLGYENTGNKIFIDEPVEEGESYDEDSELMVGEIKIKDGKLYLNITKDKVSGLKGETLILKQVPPKSHEKVVNNPSDVIKITVTQYDKKRE